MDPHSRPTGGPTPGPLRDAGRRRRASDRIRRRAAGAVLLATVALSCGPAPDADGGGGAPDGRPAPAGTAEAAAGDRGDEASPGDAEYGVRLSTDRAVYEPGDTIRMRLRVFRRGEDPITLTFPSAQRHDFVLRGPEGTSSGGEAWRWSDGRFFAQTTGTVTLGPDRPALTATASHPAPGTPGLYRLEGRLVASEWPVSAVVPVTVAP